MKTNTIIKTFAVLALAAALPACATVTKGTNFEVSVTSVPDDAKVTFVNTENKYAGEACRTPCVAKLNRKGTYKTTVSKAGFDTFEVMVFPKVSGSGVAGGVGNVVAGGIIGLAVDYSTGAMSDLYPNPINVILEPSGGESYRTDEDGNKVEDLFEDQDIDAEDMKVSSEENSD